MKAGRSPSTKSSKTAMSEAKSIIANRGGGKRVFGARPPKSPGTGQRRKPC